MVAISSSMSVDATVLSVCLPLVWQWRIKAPCPARSRFDQARGALPFVFAATWSSGDRERERECGPLAGSGRVAAEVTTHSFRQRFRDREPDARAAQRPTARLVHAIEAFEHV